MPQINAVAIPRDKPAKSATSSTDEARWRLVVAHASTSDFLYGVLSTSIFCRTSCPARRPRRANVRFFESAASAVAAGFRACRRCRPASGDPSHESPQAAAAKQVEAAREYVRRRGGDAQLSQVAAHVGLSPRYFHGLFKQVTGMTPGAYAAAVRRERSGRCHVPALPATGSAEATPVVTDNDLVHAAPIEDATYKASSADDDLATFSWPPDALASFDCVDFDYDPYWEWFNNYNLDAQGLPGLSEESTEAQLNVYLPDCVDPSLLGSSTAPS
ncbi:metal binding domain of Ada-domain-containing protein [Xylaria palmicola]|nr:metal binding domain of Ada-domain-containing protein [Xylaria palmicola]